MLLAAAAQLADHHAVAIDATLCESAFALAREALAGRSLPDSAIDLLDAAAVRAVRRGSTAVGRDDLSSAGVQLSRIAGPRRFASLASELAEAVPAQRAAAERLGEVIAARALAFDGDARPRACVLLAGSRGSGRQRLVRALARTLHGDEARTTTVELSTYGEPHHVARLFGAPAGYAGYDEGSLLARVLRRSPDALIVLRDVDRANPEVLAALAPLLREGRATDARGDALDARHATFVLTVERSLRSTRVGFVGSESSPRTDLRVPTIADAIDAVIELAAHDREALALLADARVRDLVVRLSGESVALEVDPAVALHLADLAFAADGTHTLSREFDHALLLPIGRALATRAPSRLRVQLRDGSIVIDAIE
jgi:ATP-dependent Clp protease ATP-binding subunit ClpC